MNTISRKKVALVIGSGGMKCAAALGLWKVFQNDILKSAFAFHNLAHHAEVVTVLPELDRPISSFDADQVPFVIEQGVRATEEQLPYLRRLLTGPSP